LGPLREKQEKLGLLATKDDIPYSLGKMMIYWTPLVGKQEIPGPLGEKMIY